VNIKISGFYFITEASIMEYGGRRSQYMNRERNQLNVLPGKLDLPNGLNDKSTHAYKLIRT
jgi:hypothetical protein